MMLINGILHKNSYFIMDMLMDILWTTLWTLWTILWTAYGHDDGLNIHNLWNRGLYYGYDGLCYGLPMDYTVDCLWTC